MRELFRRIHYLLNRRRLDAELENDMEFHREMAAHAGNANFGNTLRLRERFPPPDRLHHSLTSAGQ
jgi:DNA-binding FadR family transcriptional regulator